VTTWDKLALRFSDLPAWAKWAGPGGWNDPDSLEIGNGTNGIGLTSDERRTQMTLWAISAAPLLLGTDLIRMDSGDLALLTNDEVLAVDRAGIRADLRLADIEVLRQPQAANPSFLTVTQFAALATHCDIRLGA
jgi:alpha-galactosidase